MLRLTLEIVPFGIEADKKVIGEMVIANVGTTFEGSNYKAFTAPDGWSWEPAMFGKLEGYDRSQNPWELVRLLLETMRLEEHKPTEEDMRLYRKLLSVYHPKEKHGENQDK